MAEQLGLLDGAELLMDEPMASRGRRMLSALAAARPAAAVTRRYVGRHRLLVLYGVGQADRARAAAAHRARGGHVAMWDLGYWDREDGMRLAVDDLHPSAAQLALAPPGPGRREFALRGDGDPAGPIMLVGLGRKATRAAGLQPLAWEAKQVKRLARRFPGRQIRYRPKALNATRLAGTRLCPGEPIEEALVGCSLVVCRHSNVAVDAAIAGVPVECEAGAAAALFAADAAPSCEARVEFLRRLSWWNWRPGEAAAAWEWIEGVTACA